MAAALPRIEPQLVLQHKFPDVTFEYTERDVALYALGVGAPGTDPVDPLELPFVYHPDGQASIKVLPTFAVCYPMTLMGALASVKGLHFDPKLLLHGEQYTEICEPLPSRGQIRSTMRISGLHDKGKAALVELEILSFDTSMGCLLTLNRSTLFLRGAGGFSSSSQRYSYSSKTTNANKRSAPRPPFFAKPSTSPDATPAVQYEEEIRSSQALLYRLSGDYNKIHSDPVVSAEAGFQRPILHGLCTLGYAVRAVIRSHCSGDPTMVLGFQGRFLSHVYPGEKLTTKMWVDDLKSRKVKELRLVKRNVDLSLLLKCKCRVNIFGASQQSEGWQFMGWERELYYETEDEVSGKNLSKGGGHTLNINKKGERDQRHENKKIGARA